MNFEEFSGIARSLLSWTARSPSKKKSNAGFVKFSIKRWKLMGYLFFLKYIKKRRAPMKDTPL
jgi:hypothetical protein